MSNEYDNLILRDGAVVNCPPTVQAKAQHLALYDRALTPQEIAEHYIAGIALP